MGSQKQDRFGRNEGHEFGRQSREREPNPENMESRTEHWEIHKEEAVVKPSGTMKKQHRGDTESQRN
jgi:hypothetical protein